VVASAVGGLLTIVEDSRTGFLIPDRSPEHFAACTARILDNGAFAAELGRAAAARGKQFTWSLAAARLRRVYADLCIGALVECAA
jgi:glycosyltransferase involved in cell wall biosynthesis